MGLFACRIRKTNRNTDLLRLIDHAGLVPFDHYGENEDAFFVELTRTGIDVLVNHGVEVSVGDDLGASAGQRKAERAALPHDGSDDEISTGFIDHYVHAVEAAERVQSLAAEFPELCRHIILPYLTTGYDGSNAVLLGPSQVHMLRITTTPDVISKPGLLLICGTHAREWVNPLIAIEFAEQLLRNYSPGSADPDIARVNRIIEQGDIFIVPVMNPDGVNFSYYDDNGWRKNRSPNAGYPACPGVDNNRNYDIYYGGSGSSASPCNDTYRGTGAFSESENKNIRHILETYPNILIGVDAHSQGERIYRPTGSGGLYIPSLPVAAEDEAIYADLESAAVGAIEAVSGTTYLTGTTNNHAGTSDEYMFFAHRVFGFDFECAQSFQPPLLDALLAVQEITAALRILAEKAVDLEVVSPTHSSIVQCIDRTGSMIAFGYEAGARANARRFIDLMSIGDSAAIVSFADPSPDPAATPLDERAVIEAPLTEIDAPVVYVNLRDSVDSISFGGWTSIGAGLQKSVAQLGAASAPKAIVLISDGFENRAPSVATILPTIPSDIKIYTIALGQVADTVLLAGIASATGGLFYQCPGGLELHEIYNQIRADISEDDLVINEKVDGFPHDFLERRFLIEPNAQTLNLSCSWESTDCPPRVRLFSPAGREVRAGDWNVTMNCTGGYSIITVRRPAAGQWRVEIEDAPEHSVIAAFVRSPLKNHIVTGYKYDNNKIQATLTVQLKHGNMPWSEPKGSAIISQAKHLSPQTRRVEKTLRNEMLDAIPLPVLSKQPENIRPAKPHYAPLKSLNPSGKITNKGVASELPKADLPPLRESHIASNTVYAAYADLDPYGIYNMRLSIHGDFGGGFRYQRTALRTVAASTGKNDASDEGCLIVGSVGDEFGRPVTGVVVEAKDKDPFFDDLLGFANVDAEGGFKIRYRTVDFADFIFDKRPDLYLIVYAKNGKPLLTTPVRRNASRLERYQLSISRKDIPNVA